MWPSCMPSYATRMTIARRWCVVLVCLAGVVPLDARAQERPAAEAAPTITAARLQESDILRLDGVPDEPAWQRAAAATQFLQRDPDNGAPATERTEVRVLYD